MRGPMAEVQSKPAHQPRSRKGCLTCRSKKVKCDEQAPRCRRCNRLELPCEWATPGWLRPTAKAKRSALHKILPKVPPRFVDFGSNSNLYDLQEMWNEALSIPPGHRLDPTADGEMPMTACYNADTIPMWDDWYQELGFTADFLDMGTINAADQLQDSPEVDDTQTTIVPFRKSPRPVQIHWPPSASVLSAISNLGCSWQNFVLSQTFAQTGKETEALQYYTSLYPTMTITKDVRWSTYMIILRRGSQEPMVMHMIIGAALMDLATAQSYRDTVVHASRAHANAGMCLLKGALDGDVEADPVDVITACFLLFRYMSVEQDLDPVKMAHWSHDTVAYIRRNKLEDLCLIRPQSTDSSLMKCSSSLQSVSQQKQSHLARLILWTFYEDIFAGIRGYGGSIARYMSNEPQQAREVFAQSTAELESVWGAEYPEREILDDVENAPVVSFLDKVLALYAEVDQVVQHAPPAAEAMAAVELKIEKLQNSSRALFRLTTINVQPRTRIMLNAEYMIPYFYALRIYCYRSFLPDAELASPTPPHIDSCVASILQLAQRSLSRDSMDPMRARFQWPLCMAGIETNDNIHKEWVHSKMRTTSMKAGFGAMLRIQEEAGARAQMAEIKQILSRMGAALTF